MNAKRKQMYRLIERDLKDWKENPRRLPLLIRGPRQVGKTYVIEKFGQENFTSFLKIDFEFEPNAAECFATLHPEKIVAALEIFKDVRISAGETLLFLDEIQVCPQAIMALRYFKEQMPELHVIAAGSLLEFTLKKPTFRVPVGRVQYLFLQPLSFNEYLEAGGRTQLLRALEQATPKAPVPEVAHQKALDELREYIVLGGMPAVVDEALATKSYRQAQTVQTSILLTYRDDFAKYASRAQHSILNTIYERIPNVAAQWFKYAKVESTLDPRSIRAGLDLLSDAGIVHLVYATGASGIPLAASLNHKKFKLLFLDVGLLHRACGLDISLLLRDDLMTVNRGVIAEQYVGQELLAAIDRYEPRSLYFWVREKQGSSAEIDFVVNIGGRIIPIEVKAGKTGRRRSLQIFMEEKKLPIGVVISQAPLSFERGILSVPLYLTSQIPRMIREIAS
jgi:hypothetical protein